MSDDIQIESIPREPTFYIKDQLMNIFLWLGYMFSCNYLALPYDTHTATHTMLTCVAGF